MNARRANQAVAAGPRAQTQAMPDARLPADSAPHAVFATPLLGLFQRLLDRGARLSVRDYLDALRALQAGHGAGSRQALRRLTETLWARSDEERRVIARWFDAIPTPPPALLDPIDEAVQRRHPLAARADAGPDIAAPQFAAPTGGAPGGAVAAAASSGDGEASVPRARVAFGAGGAGGSGLPLPHLLAEPEIRDEYVLHPQPQVGLRQLAVLWRRYRRATRSGPKVELDLDATVRERCRQGLLRAPVLRARRRNAARLLVLADASPSMAPWQPFVDALEASLGIGRLGDVALRWFSNLPRQQLYRSARLTEPEPREALLERFAGAALLVISDAGSARGALNRRRAQLTAEFVADAARQGTRIVWINPMPEARWHGSTAALLAADPRLTMLTLGPAQMLAAVDILRGRKTAP